jgi:membrane-associated HD superfamily phosphohydrolase
MRSSRLGYAWVVRVADSVEAAVRSFGLYGVV